MEQRLVIASQILSGLVSLDRVRPLRRRVGAVRHALQLADLLQLMHCQIPPLALFDPLVELRQQLVRTSLTMRTRAPARHPCRAGEGQTAEAHAALIQYSVENDTPAYAGVVMPDPPPAAEDDAGSPEHASSVN